MEIGAILTAVTNDGSVPEVSQDRATCGRLLAFVPNVKVDILGSSLLDRTAQKLRKAGVAQSIPVIPENRAVTQVLPTRPSFANDFFSAWERAVANCVNQGVEHLLLSRTNIYSDLSFEELLRFHRERASTITQAYASDGSLDVAVVDTRFLRGCDGEYRKKLCALVPNQERFIYRGYVNRLRKPQDFRRLTEDGLYGRCDLRPIGNEIAEGVWLGEGAEVDATCTVGTPSFIGAGTHISACCTVGRGSVIERDCEVDCGTTVEESWILQATYIGLGLNVCHSIVANRRMFHLGRSTQIAIADRRLIGSTRSFPVSTVVGVNQVALNWLSD